MSKALIKLHFRRMIPILILAVVLLCYIFMFDKFSNVFYIWSDNGAHLSNSGNRFKTTDVLGRYNSLYNSSRMDSKIVEEDEAISSRRNKDEKLERRVNVENTTTVHSQFIDKQLHLSLTGYMKNKTILFWNLPYWFKVFSNFNTDLCHYKNCRVTFNRRNLGISDAVVYSLVDNGMGKIPPVEMHLRNPYQVWIFFTLESPVHVKKTGLPFMNPEWQNVFNWSWTYRTDSDIFHPYGTLITKEIVPKRNYSEIFRKKSKFVTWAVSHCKTSSKREKYVELLKQYVNVDIYGGCGRKSPADLTQLINDSYKFYLGFENLLCNDYVTEKFFNYYKLDVINIVRGMADYNRYLPKGSFINTADFPSVKALAKFMLELGSNEEEYIKYLKRKDKYKVYNMDITYRDALCSVCEKLNNIEMHKKTYSNVNDWQGSCVTANDLK